VYYTTKYGKRASDKLKADKRVVSLSRLTISRVPVFEQLRRSLNELLERATKPEDRRLVVIRMKGTLVQARLGVDDLREGLAQSHRKLEKERQELLTVRRRKELAVGIQDAETVSVAERFERQHEQRVSVLEEKVAVQTRELELAERELEEMKAEIRTAMSGVPGSVGSESLDDPLAEAGENPRVGEEIDALARSRARADRDAEASRRLEELKRKMGK
jgi:hypothetical protein